MKREMPVFAVFRLNSPTFMHQCREIDPCGFVLFHNSSYAEDLPIGKPAKATKAALLISFAAPGSYIGKRRVVICAVEVHPDAGDLPCLFF